MSARAVCFGAAVVDRKLRAAAALRPDTSNPVASERAPGGVARNVAETLARLGVASALVSLVGDDEGGRFLLRSLRAVGVGVEAVEVAPDRPTAEYIAVLEPDGRLAFGLADMAILDAITPKSIARAAPLLDGAAWTFADGNLPPPALAAVLALRRGGSFRLALDAVSAAKAARLPEDLSGVDLLVLNAVEAAAMLGGDYPPEEAGERLRRRGAGAVVLTQGAKGALVADSHGLDLVPAYPARVVDVTGAGDALAGAALARLIGGASLREAIRFGAAAASLTVESPASVRPDLSPERVRHAMSAESQV